MKIIIRQESSGDHNNVFNVIKEAFERMEISDHKEQFLVDRLRESSAFIPELSLVAEYLGKIVGHILLTKIEIIKDHDVFKSLALAPISIDPKYQKMGIGSKLIRESHKIAKSLGYKSIIVLGHPKYYLRFGYEQAYNFGIELPFEAPKESCLAIELVENGLVEVSGLVEYPKEFHS